jgi:hypothetical protein
MSVPAAVAIFATVAFLFGAAFILAAAHMGQKASKGGSIAAQRIMDGSARIAGAGRRIG